MWLVAVQHGATAGTAWAALLGALETRPGCKVVRVDNSKCGVHLPDANEAFEFSGYQEGLARVLQQAKSDDVGDQQQCSYRIAFVNDTIVQSHSRFLAIYVLNRLLEDSSLPLDEPVALGLKQFFNAEGFPGLDDQTYLSTWAFALSASREHLQSVRFYDDKETRMSFTEKVWPTLPTKYRQALEKWLRPSHPLKGWYKSVPWLPMDAETFGRKSLAIFLEHRLAERLQALGFKVQDLGAMHTGVAKWFYRALRGWDRVHTNLLKAALRLRCLWLRKSSHLI